MDYQTEIWLKLDLQTNQLIKDRLPAFTSKFFNHLRDQGMSPRTRQQYAYDMIRFFDFIFAQAGFTNVEVKTCSASDVLDKLTVEDIQEYMTSLDYYSATTLKGTTETRLSSPSIKARRISSLRSLYKYFFKIGEITNNLADLMDIPKIPEKTIVVMDKNQVERILKAVSDTSGMSEGEIKRHSRIIKRDYAIMMLFFGTGIRVSELVGIDLNDLDFYKGSLIITRKGGDEDEVFFGPEVEDALDEYINHCRMQLLTENQDENALFVSMQKKRIGVRNVENLIKNYALKAGLNLKITPHALRRTFGTNLYEETGDIYLVADALHHSSVETTRRHYARLSEDHKRMAAEKSSSLFKNDD